MSLWDDYKADRQFEYDFPFGLPRECWTMQSGETILLTDMTERHIRNCMRLVGEDDAWYGAFNKELEDRHKIDI